MFYFMNAAERREKDLGYPMAYSVVILPLIRRMIDASTILRPFSKTPGRRVISPAKAA
jgi:hypothetical protein